MPEPSLSESHIDAATLQAYLETEYRVGGPAPFVLRIGERSAALAATLARARVDCCAFIAAVNPFGQVLDEAVNARRHAELGQDLAARGLASLEGVGQHPSNGWPGEESYLVFGLPLAAAKALGTRLEQNAIVWSGADAVPQLILLR